MSSNEKRAVVQHPDSDRVAEYVAELVAQAPPISSDARARLAALLGGIAGRRAA